MTADDKRSKMTRRKPQQSERPSASEPTFERAFTNHQEPKRKLTAMITVERYDKLRRLAFERDTSMTALLSQAIDDIAD